MRKPKDCNLGKDHCKNWKYRLEVGSEGQKLIYLRTDEDTWIWIEARQIKALTKWLERASKWVGVE